MKGLGKEPKKKGFPSPRRARLQKAGVKPVKHAIIETGGKQYRVAEGDIIFIEKLNLDDGASFNFDRVLAVVDDESAKFGNPMLAGASVAASVIKNGKSKKIRVFKMKAKKGYRRTQGHRQPYTKVLIGTITA